MLFTFREQQLKLKYIYDIRSRLLRVCVCLAFAEDQRRISNKKWSILFFGCSRIARAFFFSSPFPQFFLHHSYLKPHGGWNEQLFHIRILKSGRRAHVRNEIVFELIFSNNALFSQQKKGAIETFFFNYHRRLVIICFVR